MTQEELNQEAKRIILNWGQADRSKRAVAWIAIASMAVCLFISPVLGLMATIVSAAFWVYFWFICQVFKNAWKDLITMYPHMEWYTPGAPSSEPPLDWKGESA